MNMSTNRRNRVRMLGEITQQNNKDYADDQQSIGTCGQTAHKFFQNTAIHGMRYMSDSQLTIFERLIFTAAIFLMFFLSVFFIWGAYNKWTNSPIITTLNSKSTPISKIPFPAVTICNMNLARKSVVQNLKIASKEHQMLRTICRNDIDENVGSSKEADWLTFREFLLNVSHSCPEMLVTCRYAQKFERCMDIFEIFMTDEGLCCTFNRIDEKYMLKDEKDIDVYDDFVPTYKSVDWTPEKGFPADLNRTHTFPRTGFGSGLNMGLSVLIDAQAYDYYCSSTSSNGFKVLLHSPTETPKITNYGFSITPGRETRVIVNPAISDASKQIRKIPSHQRQCIFEDEGNLSYYRVYSQKNCEMECESRLMLELCGCVMYYMPRIGPVICNQDDYHCYSNVLFSIEIELNETFKCDCLPGCFEVTYSSVVSTSKLSPGMIFLERGQNRSTPEYTKTNLAVMHVFYTNKFFRSHSKEELIGFTDFLSNMGGLLGLFMGFSVFSIIEIIYFITIRPYCAFKKSRMRNQNLPSIIQPSNQNQHIPNTFQCNSCRRRISIISQSMNTQDEAKKYLH